MASYFPSASDLVDDEVEYEYEYEDDGQVEGMQEIRRLKNMLEKKDKKCRRRWTR